MKRAPIYIQKIQVENIKTFVACTELRFTKPDGSLPQWTLLLGDNGIGKSTLLQLIAWMKPFLPYNINETDDLVPAPIINDEENEILESLVHRGIHRELTATIKAVFVANQELKELSPKSQSICKTTMTIGINSSGKLDTVEPEVETTADKIFFHDEVEIYAYSASRKLGRLNLSDPKLLDTIPNFIQERTELYDAEEILHTLNYAELGAKNENDKIKYGEFIDRIKKMLVTLLPDFDGIRNIEINPPKVLQNDAEGGIVINTKHGKRIPFGDFSLGYKTAASWTIDLAWRLFNKHHANFPNSLDAPAIVLIDEIDLHLHPIWQRTIMASLSDHFPNIQFIASAHSPLMVQAAIDLNYAVVKYDADQVTIENEPDGIDGWRIDQILTSEFFGLKSARGSKYDKLIEQRDNLLNKEKLSKKDRLALDEINTKLAEMPTGENRLEIEEKKLISDLVQKIKDKNVKIEL